MKRNFDQLREEIKNTIDVLNWKALIDLSYHLSNQIHLDFDKCDEIFKNLATQHLNGEWHSYLDKYDRYELVVYASLHRGKIEHMLLDLGGTVETYVELISILNQFPYYELDIEQRHLKICYYPKMLYRQGYAIEPSRQYNYVFDPQTKALHVCLSGNTQAPPVSKPQLIGEKQKMNISHWNTKYN